MYMLSMDPGNNTGVTLWSNKKWVENSYWHLTPKQVQWGRGKKIEFLTTQFINYLEDLNIKNTLPEKFVIEGVSLWGSSSISSAAALRGDTFNLAYLVGAYIQVALEYDMEIVIVDVREWKGNLPTKALIKEVTYQTKEEPTNEHVACAMGIGLHNLGRM